jgi:hypothetical protein
MGREGVSAVEMGLEALRASEGSVSPLGVDRFVKPGLQAEVPRVVILRA